MRPKTRNLFRKPQHRLPGRTPASVPKLALALLDQLKEGGSGSDMDSLEADRPRKYGSSNDEQESEKPMTNRSLESMGNDAFFAEKSITISKFALHVLERKKDQDKLEKLAERITSMSFHHDGSLAQSFKPSRHPFGQKKFQTHPGHLRGENHLFTSEAKFHPPNLYLSRQLGRKLFPNQGTNLTAAKPSALQGASELVTSLRASSADTSIDDDNGGSSFSSRNLDNNGTHLPVTSSNNDKQPGDGRRDIAAMFDNLSVS